MKKIILILLFPIFCQAQKVPRQTLKTLYPQEFCVSQELNQAGIIFQTVGGLIVAGGVYTLIKNDNNAEGLVLSAIGGGMVSLGTSFSIEAIIKRKELRKKHRNLIK